jgi:peptidoglycan/xylan/chitin deacetylase (PgdA/CDA1 family)
VSAHPEREPNNSDGKHVELSKFEAQMRYISRKYHVVPLKDVITLLKKREKITRSVVVVTFDDGYYNNLDCVLPVVKRFSIPITIFLTTNYADLGKDSGFLGWEEICNMHKQGVKFGAHTVTHPVLTRVSNNQAMFELRESRRGLGSRLKDDIYFFAYPYGIFNQDIADMVSEAGYSCAFTTVYGVNTYDSDLYKLKRIAINNNFSFEYFVANLFPYLRNIVNKMYVS